MKVGMRRMAQTSCQSSTAPIVTVHGRLRIAGPCSAGGPFDTSQTAPPIVIAMNATARPTNRITGAVRISTEISYHLCSAERPGSEARSRRFELQRCGASLAPHVGDLIAQGVRHVDK